MKCAYCFECDISNRVLSEVHKMGRREGGGEQGTRKNREGMDIPGITIARGTGIFHAGEVRAVPSQADDPTCFAGRTAHPIHQGGRLNGHHQLGSGAWPI